MATFEEGLEQGMRNAFCDVTRTGVSAGLIFAGLSATTGAGLAAGLLASGASLAAYALFCGEPPPEGDRPRRPFRGGQCPVAYQVNFLYTRRDLASNEIENRSFFFRLQGPLTKAQITSTQTPANGPLLCEATGIQETLAQELIIAYGSLPNNPFYEFTNLRTEIFRLDGQPDTCGDPPYVPPVFPPGSNVYPTNVTYNNRFGVTVNAPVTLRFGLPFVVPGGGINIPVSVNFDADVDLSFSGNLNFNTGDFVLNVGDPADPAGGNDGGPDVVTDPTLPPPPPGSPGDPPPVPTPDPKVNRTRNIKACIVTVTNTDDEATIIFQGENPDIYVPALGYVSFYILTKTGGAWTEDIPVKGVRQFIECPWDLGAAAVKGTPRGDGQMTVTPIYTTVSYNPVYPPESV